MYFKEHGAPHFHALYNEFNGVFKIETLELIEEVAVNLREKLV